MYFFFQEPLVKTKLSFYGIFWAYQLLKIRPLCNEQIHLPNLVTKNGILKAKVHFKPQFANLFEYFLQIMEKCCKFLL